MKEIDLEAAKIHWECQSMVTDEGTLIACNDFTEDGKACVLCGRNAASAGVALVKALAEIPTRYLLVFGERNYTFREGKGGPLLVFKKEDVLSRHGLPLELE